MAGNRWTEQTMMSFVLLYEAHPCLWNVDSPDYKDRELRKAALASLIKELGMPNFSELDCKNKIKNMRSHYCQELKKIKMSAKNATCADDVYKPSLSWFSTLDEFLRPFVVQKSDLMDVSLINRYN